MGVVVIGGGGSGGGGNGNKVTASDGKVYAGEQVVAMFSAASDAEAYARLLNREDARVIPFMVGIEV